MSRHRNLDEFKDFVSAWSSKTVGGTSLDALLAVDGIPLSWFYRPILYSSLLPRPFATIDDLRQARKISALAAWKTALCSYGYRKYLSGSDIIKRSISTQKKYSLSAKPRILLLTFTNHLGKETFRLGKIGPLISAQGTADPLVLVADPFSHCSLRKILASDHTLYHYYTAEILQKATNLAVQRSQQWSSIPADQKTRVFTYHGQDFYPFLRRHLDFLYSQEFISLVLRHYYAFQKALEEENVQAIILTSQNNIIEKCLIAAAQARKIPVIVVQHGIGLGYLPTLDTPPHVYFAVFSQKYKQGLVEQGLSKKNVLVTGPIIFDGIERFISPRKRKEKSILLATSPIVEDRFLEKETYFSRISKILSELKKRDPTITIIIKLHPRERYRERYGRALQESGLSGMITAVLNRDEHYALIAQSGLVITFGSTVALEAMIIGRPTLTIDLFDGKNPLNDTLRSTAATTVVHYAQDLGEVAASLLRAGLLSAESDRKAKKFVQQLCHKTDGKASERVVQYVYRLMGLKLSL